MIPFLTQLRSYIWIIPVSISFVQIHFWLVINVTSYFIFSLQTDLIWSSVFYMWRWLAFQNSCWETAKEIIWHTSWGDNVKKLQTVDETVTLAIMGCEKNMLLPCAWEQWEKFLFYFLHDLLKTDSKTSLKTPVYHFIKWYTKKHLWIFQKLYEFLKNILKLKKYIYVIDLDIWLSGCQAINEHL